jgi:hypothetical protein
MINVVYSFAPILSNPPDLTNQKHLKGKNYASLAGIEKKDSHQILNA